MLSVWCGNRTRLPAAALVVAALAAVLLVFYLQPVFSQTADTDSEPTTSSESARGVIITQDNDNNVNVTIDPALIPDVQIKRNDGQMTIELSDDNFNGSAADAELVIDSPLKSSKTVNTKKNKKGRVVTINSDKVFLSIQELSKSTLKEAKTELSKPRPIVIRNPSALVQPVRSSLDQSSGELRFKLAPPPPQVLDGSVPPATTTVTLPQEIIRRSNRRAAARRRSSTTSRRDRRTTQKQPIAKEKATTKQAQTQKQTEEPTRRVARRDANTVPFGEIPLEDEGEAVSALSISEPESGADSPADMPSQMLTDSQGNPVYIDPSLDPSELEEVPLTFYQEKRDGVQSITSMDSLIRIIGSLVIVLLLLFGFMKFILPTLVSQFPHWFKQQEEQYEKNKQRDPRFGAGRDKRRKGRRLDRELSQPRSRGRRRDRADRSQSQYSHRGKSRFGQAVDQVYGDPASPRRRSGRSQPQPDYYQDDVVDETYQQYVDDPAMETDTEIMAAGTPPRFREFVDQSDRFETTDYDEQQSGKRSIFDEPVVAPEPPKNKKKKRSPAAQQHLVKAEDFVPQRQAYKDFPRAELVAPNPQQQAYLSEELDSRYEQFDVVKSVRLTHDKDIHLVEVESRYLVVATTPESVHFLTELNEQGVPTSGNQMVNTLLNKANAYLAEDTFNEQGWPTLEDQETEDTRWQQPRKAKAMSPSPLLEDTYVTDAVVEASAEEATPDDNVANDNGKQPDALQADYAQAFEQFETQSLVGAASVPKSAVTDEVPASVTPVNPVTETEWKTPEPSQPPEQAKASKPESPLQAPASQAPPVYKKYLFPEDEMAVKPVSTPFTPESISAPSPNGASTPPASNGQLSDDKLREQLLGKSEPEPEPVLDPANRVDPPKLNPKSASSSPQAKLASSSVEALQSLTKTKAAQASPTPVQPTPQPAPAKPQQPQFTPKPLDVDPDLFTNVSPVSAPLGVEDDGWSDLLLDDKEMKANQTFFGEDPPVAKPVPKPKPVREKTSAVSKPASKPVPEPTLEPVAPTPVVPAADAPEKSPNSAETTVTKKDDAKPTAPVTVLQDYDDTF